MKPIQILKRLNKISKQEVLTFVAAHPKLTALLAGVGITITFSFVGRFALESLSFSTPAFAAKPADFPTDIPAEKFPKLLAPCTECVDKIPFFEGDTEL